VGFSATFCPVQSAENKPQATAGILSALLAGDYFYAAGTSRIPVFELHHFSEFICLMLF